jgi:hypothetical protein
MGLASRCSSWPRRSCCWFRKWRTSVWWKLPYRIEGQEASTAIGFWVYVPSVALFTYTSWLVLLRAGNRHVIRMVTLSCALALLLLLFTPSAALLWQDVYGESYGTVLAFWLLLPLIAFYYYVSWILIMHQRLLAEFLWQPMAKWLARWAAWVWQTESPPDLPGWLRNWQVRSRLVWWLLYLFVFVPALALALVNLLLLVLNRLTSGVWVDLTVWLLRAHRTAMLVPAGLLAAAALVLWIGYCYRMIEIHASYPAPEAWLGQAVFPILFLFVWMVLISRFSRAVIAAQPTPLEPVAEVTGRILFQLLTIGVVAEVLWAAPTSAWLAESCSYRLYTIWAAFYLAFGLVALGTWTDVCHRSVRP